jgi:hypothetical protein
MLRCHKAIFTEFNLDPRSVQKMLLPNCRLDILPYLISYHNPLMIKYYKISRFKRQNEKAAEK